jgi:uncharacterized protein
MPAGRAVVVIAVCLLTWTILYAPALKRASEAQPLGTRRTVSLDVLRPIAAISDVTGLGSLADAIQRAAGHGPNSLLQAEPLPTASKPPGIIGPPLRTSSMRDFTADNKLRVVIVGDSLAQGLGFYMERVLSPTLVRVSSQGRISTGLARPDYFNWPAEMQRIEDVFHPDLVIVMLGENDHQSLLTPSGQLDTKTSTSAWPNAYSQRVQQFVHIAVDNGSHVVWAGLPVISDTSKWDYIRRVDGIYSRVMLRTPNAAYLDTWAMFTTPGGRYTPFMRINGKVVPVREADGIHFTAAGYQLVARAAVGIAEQRFSLAPKAVA